MGLVVVVERMSRDEGLIRKNYMDFSRLGSATIAARIRVLPSG